MTFSHKYPITIQFSPTAVVLNKIRETLGQEGNGRAEGGTDAGMPESR